MTDIKFPEGAEDYYDLELARAVLESPVPEGCVRWRCILCGFPADYPAVKEYMIGASCCGGCGMTCMRPIEEYKG